MALKFEIDKVTFDKLSKEVQAEYKAVGAGYQLDLEGYEDPAALKRARDHEKRAAAEAKAELDAVKTKLAELEEDAKKKPADIQAAEAALKKKHDKELTERETTINSLKAVVSKSLVDTTAAAIAERISTVPSLMAKEIAGRLSVDFSDLSKPELVVMDAAGKPRGDLTSLEKEFLTNKDFAPILRGTKATGGSAPGPSGPGGGAPAKTSDNTPPDLSKLPPDQLAAHMTALREARQNNQGA